MTRRESKGQTVKTFKHFEPQLDGSSVERIGKVWFEANSGDFVVYLPEHIGHLLPEIYPGGSCEARAGDGKFWWQPKFGTLRSKTMNCVVEAHTHTLAKFRDAMTVRNKKKVILVWYKSNLRRIEGHTRPGRNDQISFIANPALLFQYQVLFEANNTYYREVENHFSDKDGGPPTRLEYAYSRNSMDGARVVDWTQEREDFFRLMVDRIENTIVQLDIFTADLGNNVDLAIANLSGTLALAGPKTALEDQSGDEELVG